MNEKKAMLQNLLENAKASVGALQNRENRVLNDNQNPLLIRLGELEEQLRLSEARYSAMVESQREMVCRWTPDRTLSFVNDAVCRFWGQSRRQLIGAGIRDGVVHEDAERLEQALAGLSDEKPYAHIEYRVRLGDDIRWTYWTYQAICDPQGRLLEIQSLGRDISRQKQAEDDLRRINEHLEQRVRERTMELEAKHRELTALNIKIRRLTRKIHEATENDHRTIAREMHDSIGAGLSAIKFSLEQRLSEMDELPDSGRLSFEQILDYLNDTIKETKRIARGLRPSTLDDLGLLMTIDAHINKTEEIYPDIGFKRNIRIDEADVPEPLKIVVYRILQEALNNACKHSGADTIRIDLNKEEEFLILILSDNGRGFEIRNANHDNGALEGYGLQSMQDRVEICGGKLHIQSALDEGTRVQVRFPCRWHETE